MGELVQLRDLRPAIDHEDGDEWVVWMYDAAKGPAWMQTSGPVVFHGTFAECEGYIGGLGGRPPCEHPPSVPDAS